MLDQFNGAVMDSERKRRFLLWRSWDDKPRMLFIGLNPSTANEISNDPTIRRLEGFAHRWGFGGLYVCNVFSQVTPHPEELKEDTAMHSADIHAIRMGIELSDLIICGWGDGIKKAADYGLSRASTIKYEIPDSNRKCFGLTASGNPKHPLYLPKESELQEFR